MHFSICALSVTDYIHTKYLKRMVNIVTKSEIFSCNQQLMLSNLIRELALLKCVESILNNIPEQRIEAEDFLALYYSNWYGEVYCVLSEQQKVNRAKLRSEKPTDLNEPVNADFRIFKEFLNKEISIAKNHLPDKLERLKKLTLAMMILANQEQLRSVEKISVENYLKAAKPGDNTVNVSFLHNISIEEIVKGYVAYLQ